METTCVVPLPINAKRVIGMWPCVNERDLVLCIVKLYFYIWSRHQAVFWVSFSFRASHYWGPGPSIQQPFPRESGQPAHRLPVPCKRFNVLVTPGGDKRIFFCWPLQITTLLLKCPIHTVFSMYALYGKIQTNSDLNYHCVWKSCGKSLLANKDFTAFRMKIFNVKIIL